MQETSEGQKKRNPNSRVRNVAHRAVSHEDQHQRPVPKHTNDEDEEKNDGDDIRLRAF